MTSAIPDKTGYTCMWFTEAHTVGPQVMKAAVNQFGHAAKGEISDKDLTRAKYVFLKVWLRKHVFIEEKQ